MGTWELWGCPWSARSWMPSHLLTEALSEGQDGAWTSTNHRQRLELALVPRCVTHPLVWQKLLQKEDPWIVPFVETLQIIKPAPVGLKKPLIISADPSQKPNGCPSVHDPYSLPAPLHGTGHSSQFGYFYFVGLGNLIKSRRVQTCNCPFPNWSFWNTWH